MEIVHNQDDVILKLEQEIDALRYKIKVAGLQSKTPKEKKKKTVYSKLREEYHK